MQDDDLSALDPLADYVVSLDLTNSKVTDEGLGLLLRMKNLEKLNLEGTKSVTVDGIAKLKALEKLSYLNLVRVQMDDTLVDTLIGMENLREVYLYQSGLTEDAMGAVRRGQTEDVREGRLSLSGFHLFLSLRKTGFANHALKAVAGVGLAMFTTRSK